MAAIAAGVLAAIWCFRLRSLSVRQIRLAGVIGALAVAAVFLAEDVIWPTLGSGTMLLLTAGTALLTVALYRGFAARWMRAMGVLRSFGRLSYETYLTHMFAVWPIVFLYHASGGGLRAGWVCFVPIVIASWCLGWALDRFVSTPADRALRRRLV